MAQYEWVDVYSLKRWGDPSTMGSIGGNFGSGGKYQYGNSMKFNSGEFSIYEKHWQYNAVNEKIYDFIKIKTIDTDKINIGGTLKESSRSSIAEHEYKYHSANYIICDTFDKYSLITRDGIGMVELDIIEINFAKWSLGIVLEDGTIVYTDIYDTPVSNTSLRLNVMQSSMTDISTIGKLKFFTLNIDKYAVDTYHSPTACYSNPFTNTDMQSNNMSATYLGTGSRDYRFHATYNFIITNIKFLKK